MSDKPGRGGRRQGAGRKPLPPEKKGRKQVVVMTAFAPDILARLDEMAVDQQTSRAAIIRNFVLQGLAKHQKGLIIKD